jgi:ubiquinone biosynthesis protein
VAEFDGTDEQRLNLAKIGLKAVIKQLLEDGFFHGDPHGGNVIVVNGETLCFIDWGQAGRVVRNTRDKLLDVMLAVLDRDEIALTEAGFKLCDDQHERAPFTLERAMLETLDDFYLTSTNRRSLGHFMFDLLEAFRRHRLHPPADLVLMIIALLEAEGLARTLYPDINIVELAKPLVMSSLVIHHQPMKTAKRLLRSSREIVHEMSRLPWRLSRVAEKMQDDRFTLVLQHQGLTQFTRSLERASNRLAYAIVIGALIIGSSMVLVAGTRPLVYGYSLLGLLGYLFSAILGIWMVIGFVRQRKMW